MTMEPGIKNCCICGKEFTGYGHSPHPVMDGDLECCDWCNARVVLPRRAELSKKHEVMRTELEKIKAHIEKQTADMEQSAKIELLHNLAWWASEEAGRLDFESEDVEDYD